VLFSGQRHSPTLRQDICQFFFQVNSIYSKFVRARDVRFIYEIKRTLRIWEVALFLGCISSSLHKMAVSPELLVTGHADEIFVKAVGSRLAGQGTYNGHDPVDNHSRVSWAYYRCYWLHGCCWHSACKSSCCHVEFCRRTLYSFQSCNLAPPFWFRYFCPRGSDVDLDGNASWIPT